MKKTIILLSALITVSVNLFSQDSNYDAVYNKLVKVYTLNSDGSMDYRYSKEMKLQTYRSFHNLYGETFITYNPSFQTLKVEKVQTTMANGTKVNAPSNALNEVLPSFAANAPAYNGLREMVVTHPGTERNAILSIDYSIHSKKGFYPALMGMEVLSETEPVKDLTLKIRVPLQTKLNFKVIGNTSGSMEPAVTNEQGYQVYTWNLKDVPAISTEENQKGYNELYPRVIFSTAKDRQTVYKAFTGQPAFKAASGNEMENYVSGIMVNNKEPYDVILKLQEKVVNDLRLFPVPMRLTGFNCRTAMETFSSNGGTPAEKAILLVALLKEAGIPAYLGGVIKNSYFDPAIGNLLDIEDILVIASGKDIETLYLSVSNLNQQSLKYGLPGRTVVIFNPEGKSEVLKTDEFKNKISLITKLTINSKKQTEGEVSATFTNNADPWFTQLRDKVKMKNFFTGGISSADLKELKIVTTGPVEGYVKYSALKENPFRHDSSFYFYTLPAITSGIDNWGIHLLPASRTTPFEIPSVMEENYDLTLVTGPLTLFNSGKKTEIKNNCGSFFYEARQDGDKLVIRKNIYLTKRIIDPEDYAAFKLLMDNWNSNNTREIVLKEK